MAATSVQFAVATHVMAALGFRYGSHVSSRDLAASVNADPTFVRKAISKLVKAGLVQATRGPQGACALARPPEQITLRDIYLASEAPGAFALHSYPIAKSCPVSSHLNICMEAVLDRTQRRLEEALAQTTLAEIVADLRDLSKREPPKPKRK